ncbi:MAG: orotate phosphoribosyltransferase [Bacteriovoracaceae bacterium]|nr:orotate phosphoribosyltransferase [Bacteriovoracaceae bacterium]
MISSKEISQILLDIKAVHLNPTNYFTWTSGIKSPIYCDNRKIISHHEYRTQITKAFADHIQTFHKEVEVIAGTATAGIPWASWIAQELKLPLVYVRSGAKAHGLKNQVEGSLSPQQKVILIEDLISTGKSSIEAAQAITGSGAEVLSIISIFSYDFESIPQIFKKAGYNYTSLTNLNSLLTVAEGQSIITKAQVEEIKTWKKTITL